MILFSQPYLTIEYDASLSCLIQHWQGYAKSEQFRDGIERSVTYFREKELKIDKIISNTKDFAVVKKEDTDFAANEATPVMVAHGLKYIAFIVPTNIFTQLSVNSFKSQADEIVKVRHFDDLQKAKEWLASVE